MSAPVASSAVSAPKGITMTLPDGATRAFDAPVSGIALAKDISPSLAKKALAMVVDGEPRDLSYVIDRDAAVAVITPESPEGLELIRHDAAHMLAEAVTELYDDVQVTIGPATATGFYYDFARDEPFSVDDLPAIEARMREIAKRDEAITREEWDRDDAIRFFEEQGEAYKAEIIRDLPAEETISLYRQGNFIDLCRGPHAPSTGRIKHFKLLKVAGAYWRGDSRNPMLQRIYGTAFATKEDLAAYLHQLEEAEKRDHRKLGQEMDLFHFQEEAPGSVFWHARGWTMFLALIDYMRRRQRAQGYTEVSTPEVMDRSLWEASGHWQKFGENMFTARTVDEDKDYAIRPMNCPGGVQVYKQGITSYRDLPRRIAEFGKVHRFEPSGALHGLLRVRAFTQDDAHIFCTEAQITDECTRLCDQILGVYKDFGFEDVRIKFSDRPEQRVGDDAVWDASEAALKAAVDATGLEYTLNPGEGAFYGPKLEFVLRDAIGRDWQAGTVQVDLNLPERLGATYIGEDGQKHYPVMIHRALFGSLERFTGILIEHYAGRLPLWLSPVQVVVAGITNEVDDYVHEVNTALNVAGLRSESDTSAEKIGYKVRLHSNAKVPVICAVGKQERENGQVALRRLGSREQQVMPLDEAIAMLRDEALPPDRREGK